MQRLLLPFCVLLFGCAGDDRRSGGPGDAGSPFSDAAHAVIGDAGVQAGCAGQPQGCYTVYAHSNHKLYSIDLLAKSLVEVGPFNAPKVQMGTKMSEDVMTDLAVAPDDTIYVISHTNLYTASPTDGHVTLVGPVTTCGTEAVALSFTPDGTLYAGDYQGALCKIDLAKSPPVVQSVGTLSGNLALAGDLVAVDDGTVYGTAYDLNDPPKTGTQANNLLVKIDVSNGATQVIGSTHAAELFGVAYALGQVFGFTHDGSGHVITIDPATGAGTPFNTFKDPTTSMGISFAGAGVNSKVSAIVN